MKKLQTRIILLLIAVTLASSVLAHILSWTLAPIIFEGQTQAFAEMFGGTVQTGITLIFFALFVILIIRELMRPIGSLSAAAKRIAGGDLEVELPNTRRTDEIGELERNFRSMVRELKGNEAMQKDFIQNVSHEFKTPLTVIAGYAKMLEQEAFAPQEQAECSRRIIEEAGRLSAMTTNILLLSKLDNAGIRPLFGPFSLDEQLRQVVLTMEAKWRAKDTRLELALEPTVLCGSEELLAHVWMNLIDNAVKFSPAKGRVAIRARAAGGLVQVQVADDGAGMDEETLAKVFEQFYQGDTSHYAAGNGLGLPLVKRIIGLHGGDISIKSGLGAGSTFTVALPAAGKGACPGA